MTNADTVFLATKDLVKDLINPFSGKTLKQEKSNGIKVWNTAKGEHNPMPLQNKKTLSLKSGFYIHKDFYQVDEWEQINEYK